MRERSEERRAHHRALLPQRSSWRRSREQSPEMVLVHSQRRAGTLIRGMTWIRQLRARQRRGARCHRMSGSQTRTLTNRIVIPSSKGSSSRPPWSLRLILRSPTQTPARLAAFKPFRISCIAPSKREGRSGVQSEREHGGAAQQHERTPRPLGHARALRTHKAAGGSNHGTARSSGITTCGPECTSTPSSGQRSSVIPQGRGQSPRLNHARRWERVGVAAPSKICPSIKRRT